MSYSENQNYQCVSEALDEEAAREAVVLVENFTGFRMRDCEIGEPIKAASTPPKPKVRIRVA